MRTEEILEARSALTRARACLLKAADEYQSRALENAFARTDEALGWIGRLSLDARRRAPAAADYEFPGGEVPGKALDRDVTL